MAAKLFQIRREVIEAYMLTSSSAAEGYIHVPFEFQQAIRDALSRWWGKNIASDRGRSGWQGYLAMGAPGDKKRSMDSYFKTWKHKFFGNTFLFDFFVAYGTITKAMVDALNESLQNRAAVMGDNTTDPASSRETPLDRLSARNQAERRNEPIPQVQGIVARLSPGQLARGAVREMEQELKSLENQEWRQYQETKVWTPKQDEDWIARRYNLACEWRAAEELSYAAGHDFTDRRGNRIMLTEESIVTRAVRTYASNCTWQWDTVVRWKIHYEAALLFSRVF